MSEEKAPQWAHELPIDLARFVRDNCITKITHHWRMTGVDTAENWITLHAENKKTKDVPSHQARFFTAGGLVFTAGHHNSLVQLSSYHNFERDIDAIDKFNKSNARERAAYERLKKKFEA